MFLFISTGAELRGKRKPRLRGDTIISLRSPTAGRPKPDFRINVFIIGAIFYGFGFGYYHPQLMLIANNTAAKPIYGAIAISLYSSCMGIGQFLSPMVITFLKNLFGITHPRGEWLIAGIGIVVCSAVASVFIIVKKPKQEPA